MSTITTHKLGPGKLAIGATGSETQFGVRVSEAILEPDIKEDDPVRVLSGDYVDDGDAAVRWTLKGKVYQDYTTTSLIKWCNENNGKMLAFTFQPRSDQVLAAKGTVKVRPIAMGGKVDERNDSDFEFQATGVTFYDATVTP